MGSKFNQNIDYLSDYIITIELGISFEQIITKLPKNIMIIKLKGDNDITNQNIEFIKKNYPLAKILRK